MEAIIIIVIISIVGYLIYQSLTSTKFERASNLILKGDLKAAEKILHSIFDGHAMAPARLAECYLIEGLNAKSKNQTLALTLWNQSIDMGKKLPGKTNRGAYTLIQAKSFCEVARTNFNNVDRLDPDLRVKQLKTNLQYIETATKIGIETEFESLRHNHFYELAVTHHDLAKQKELSMKLIDAIQLYSDSFKYACQCRPDHKISYDSITRTAICKLKNNEDIISISFDEINKSSHKMDFYYRYAASLLRNNNYSEAEVILSNHLDIHSKGLSIMKQAIKNEKLKRAGETLREINGTIEALFENKYPIDKTQEFYDSLDKRIVEIIAVIPNLAPKLKELKPSLFNKLLIHYIAIEEYANAINLILRFPLFWESPELLKNLGICCFGFTAQGNLNLKNYQIVISSWLTSIFADDVILNSLEATSWDDPFTFTLTESIGSIYVREGLPENVNYETASDTNISIGATQKELMQQYETLLHQKTSEHNLSKAINDFYENEKRSIEGIVSVIENKVRFAAPYFAKSYGMNELIVAELNDHFNKSEDDASLEVGVPYLKNNLASPVGEFSKAKNLLTKILLTIEQEQLDDLKPLFNDNNKQLLEKYESINDKLEDTLFSAFNTKLSADDLNEKLIPIMDETIGFISSNEKLKLQYSNFVTDYCVAQVNEGQISNYYALTFMLKAYLYSKENIRVCKNIITLIRNSLMDILNEKKDDRFELYSLLDSIARNRSQVFKRNASELAETRKHILGELVSAGVDVSSLTESYSFNLTPHGEIMKKVLFYLKTLSGEKQFIEDDLPF